MTRPLDRRSVEAAIVRNCAPALDGIKPACLFTFPGTFEARRRATPAERRQLHETRARLQSIIDALLHEIAESGVRIRVLAWRSCGALVYVYRPAALASYLADARAARPLTALGYDPLDVESCLDLLAVKLGRDARRPIRKRLGRVGADEPQSCPCPRERCHRAFPHEMGFFLGYPYADVTGFIEHDGRDFILSGPWKVYEDRDGALAMFERLRSCAARYQHVYQRGIEFSQLVATGA